MVDVSEKDETRRIAIATGSITMAPETFALLKTGTSKKGDVLGIARIGGIQAAKRTAEMIPLCHPIFLTHVDIEFDLDEPTSTVTCTVRTETLGRTGVEMEALCAVNVALLTVYDMLKAVDRSMVIHSVKLLEKRGGKSGEWKL